MSRFDVGVYAKGYAVEAGLLESNPADRISWRAPKASPVVDPAIVASSAQAQDPVRYMSVNGVPGPVMARNHPVLQA